ncbi:MAG: DUF6691 family protein, partial [Pseudolabrys sp.]
GAGFALARQQKQPMLTAQHLWPTRIDVDRSLVAGSVLVGLGWGLAGRCPGPALVNIAGLWPSVIVFVLAMTAGMILKDLWDRRVPSAIVVGEVSLSTSTDG